MLGGADNPNGELLSYIIGADITGLSDCHSPGRIRLPLRRMLNALCSRGLQVRFIYAGYTPAIRDSPVGTTQSAATA